MLRKEIPATVSPKPVISTAGVKALGEALRGVNVDRFVRSNLWPQWLEDGYQICDHCGYVISPTTGICAANSVHVTAPYNHKSRLRSVLLR